MKVLVYGATGSQAKPVVFELIKKGHTALAFTRDATKAQDLAEAGAEIIEGDMANYADTLQASQKADAVALLVPTFGAEPLKMGQNAIKAAQEANIGHIVWNTSGVIPPEKTGNPAYDIRQDILEALQQSGVPHIVLQPTLYAENLLGPWTAPFVKEQNKVAYPTLPDFKIGWLPSADMAKLIVAGLEKPALAGKQFVVSGQEALSGTALAASFSKALQKDIAYHALPPQEFGGILNNVMGEGAGDGVAAEYQAIWDGKVDPVMYVDMEAILQQFEVAFTPMEDWVKSFDFMFN